MPRKHSETRSAPLIVRDTEPWGRHGSIEHRDELVLQLNIETILRQMN